MQRSHLTKEKCVVSEENLVLMKAWLFSASVEFTALCRENVADKLIEQKQQHWPILWHYQMQLERINLKGKRVRV